MTTCEKCWSDAKYYRNSIEMYDKFVSERNCTPEQQAGPHAKICSKCQRKTIHQNCGICMNPKCKAFGQPG